MKPLSLEIEEKVMTGTVDENGDFKFYFYASNECDGEFEKAMAVLLQIWELETEVTFRVHFRVKAIYDDLYEMFNAGGKIQQVDTPRFEALRKDCQWIIDQINELEMNT